MNKGASLCFISLITSNQLTILQRIVSLLSRCGAVVEQINLSGNAFCDKHHLSLAIRASPEQAHKLVAQLNRLVDVVAAVRGTGAK